MLVNAVAERLPQLGNGVGEAVLLDRHVRPDGVEEGILGQQCAGIPEKGQEEREDLRGQWDEHAFPVQLPPNGVDQERPETHLHNLSQNTIASLRTDDVAVRIVRVRTRQEVNHVGEQ